MVSCNSASAGGRTVSCWPARCSATAPADKLKTLQDAASKGEELTFSADITKALDLQKVVITEFSTAAVAGEPGRYHFRIVLAESPPLPPPAQVSAFGGLDGFGLGDLGFDTSVLGDIAFAGGRRRQRGR